MSLRNILSVNVDDETGNYNISIPTGSNVAETAFAMAVVIKCFVKDKVIDNYNVVTEMLEKYLTDSQYEEVEDDSV